MLKNLNLDTYIHHQLLMQDEKDKAASSQTRRNFIGNTLRLTALGSLVTLQQACTNSSDKNKPGPKGKKQTAQNKKKPRTKWNYEKLIAHTKTNVVHFPTSKYFNYYDKIDSKYIRELDMTNWEQELQPPLHFNKKHAAIILEILALQKLVSGLSPDTLAAAEKTISKAFSNEFENVNGQNIHVNSFRLHDLMMKCIALNPSIPPEEKWNRFRGSVHEHTYKEKEPGTKKGLPERMRWLTSPEFFDAKVKYIAENQNQFITKLQERVAKNKFI